MGSTQNFVGGGGLKRRVFDHVSFSEVISLENLFLAWQEFRKGKRSKLDVMTFEYTLEDNIFQLHHDLVTGAYRHGNYQQFKITDPKVRLISKSGIRDRLLHHAIYRVLYPCFDKTFIYDSYSCRNRKGTHKSFIQLQKFVRKISKNYTQPCFALKSDIRKFFDSIDHKILMDLLKERINDEQLLDLLQNIINSFEHSPSRGIPLGNLTSQLFANVYLDPLDKFAKHYLKAKHYLRYADDFMFLSSDRNELIGYLLEVNQFIKTQLKLNIHPNKIHLRKFNWGIDYVGYVALPHYSIPRRKTAQRIFKKIRQLLKKGELDKLAKAIPSYLGYLGHANAYKLQNDLLKSCRVGKIP
ncbi:MAG: reverse transcriptase/maturase family protein [Patescibacteria group bacterium]